MPRVETISFTRGVPPHEALRHVERELQTYLAAAVASDAARILQYGQPGGYELLRNLLAQQYGVLPNQVMVSNGSLQLLDLLSAHLVTSNHRTVFTEAPTYDRALTTFRHNRGRVAGIAIEADGLNVDVLKRRLKSTTPAFLYLIPDFQNPTGITMSLAKRQAVVKLAERHGFYIIEDVPYRQLRYTGDEVPLLRELSPERVVTISSYSKLIAPGLRCGYAIGPAPLIAELIALGEQTYLSPVLVTQAAVAAFVADGHLQTQVEWLRRLYEPRMDAMLQALKKYLPGASVTIPMGGFFIGIQLPPAANVTNLVQRAKSAGLLLTPGRNFFSGNVPEAHRFVRLPFCAVAPSESKIGIKRLAELL